MVKVRSQKGEQNHEMSNLLTYIPVRRSWIKAVLLGMSRQAASGQVAEQENVMPYRLKTVKLKRSGMRGEV